MYRMKKICSLCRWQKYLRLAINIALVLFALVILIFGIWDVNTTTEAPLEGVYLLIGVTILPYIIAAIYFIIKLITRRAISDSLKLYVNTVCQKNYDIEVIQIVVVEQEQKNSYYIDLNNYVEAELKMQLISCMERPKSELEMCLGKQVDIYCCGLPKFR